jgi:hypothetical protein
MTAWRMLQRSTRSRCCPFQAEASSATSALSSSSLGLQRLDMSSCRQLQGICLVHLVALTGLLELSMTDTGIKNSGLVHLAVLTDLLRLSLAQCRNISGGELSGLAPLTCLRHLDIRHCRQLNNAALMDIPALPALQHLAFWADDQPEALLSDSCPAVLKALTNVVVLDLSRSQNVTDAGIAHVAALRHLLILNMPRAAHITDACGTLLMLASRV